MLRFWGSAYAHRRLIVYTESPIFKRLSVPNLFSAHFNFLCLFQFEEVVGPAAQLPDSRCRLFPAVPALATTQIADISRAGKLPVRRRAHRPSSASIGGKWRFVVRSAGSPALSTLLCLVVQTLSSGPLRV